MQVKFQSIGWKSKVMQRRSTFSISINKLVATGTGIKKGDLLYCYLAEDQDKRPMLLIFLDKQERSVKGA